MEDVLQGPQVPQPWRVPDLMEGQPRHRRCAQTAQKRQPAGSAGDRRACRLDGIGGAAIQVEAHTGEGIGTKCLTPRGTFYYAVVRQWQRTALRRKALTQGQRPA